MKSIRKPILFAAALTGVLALAPAGLAQAPPPTDQASIAAKPLNAPLDPAAGSEDPWRFDFALVGWVALPIGNVTVHGRQADVNVSLDELVDHLDGIAMFGLGLRKEKFGFYVQPNWVKLSADGTSGPFSATLDSHIWIVDAAGFYQVAKWGQEKPVTLDVLAGVREINFGNELTIRGQDGIVNFNSSDSFNLINPIVGVRSKIYLTPKISLSLHGDVGGDIATDTSALSWQAQGLLAYDFSRHFSLFLGYRALSVNKSTGSGSQEKGVDLIFRGPELVLDFHW